MTPSEMVHALMERGMTQQQIADYCGARQENISRILHEKTKWPRYTIVDRLRELLTKAIYG